MKILSLFFLLASLVFLRLLFFYAFPLVLHTGQKMQFTSTLWQDPKVVGNNQEFFVTVGDFWQSTQVLVITPASANISFGQTLALSGTVSEKVLSNKNVVLAIKNPQIMAKNDSILPIFGSLRARALDFCENNFSQPYSGLLVGIIFGFKNAIPAQISASFRITGLSHLLVVDGLKITLAAGFLMSVCATLLKRRAALVVSILIIVLYIGLSGFEISAVRAGIMAIASFSALFFGRQYSSMYVLAVLTGIFLLLNPLLLQNVAFQLSVLATAGISLLGSDEFTITLAAQVATLPILLTTFGSISLISLPIHLLVMWIIPFIMLVGGLGIALGLVLAPVGFLITSLIIPLLWFLQQAALFFSNYPLQVQVANFPWEWNVGYYLLLVALIVYVKRERKIFTNTN